MADDEEALEKNINEAEKKNQFQNEDNYDSEEERKKKKQEDEKVWDSLFFACSFWSVDAKNPFVEAGRTKGKGKEEAGAEGLRQNVRRENQ